MINKKHIAVIFTICLLIGAGIGVFYKNAPSQLRSHLYGAQDIVLAKIKGLSAGDIVSYKLESEDKALDIKPHHVTADMLGEAKISISQDVIDEVNASIDMAIEVMNAGETQSMHMSFSSQGALNNFKSTGLDAFSNVMVRTKSGLENFKADWTGSFVLPGLQQAQNEDEYEIALFGQNLKPDSQDQAPLRIQVLSTDGGGGPNSVGVNQYSHEGCGNPKLSMCKGDEIDDQTKAITERYVDALQRMSVQFTSMMMKYTEIMGQFMDAKMQLQTRLRYEELQAQAHKDYHPSEQMCRFGTFTKSLATVEESAKFNKLVVNKILVDRYTNTRKVGAKADPLSSPVSSDLQDRLALFRERHCNRADLNNGLDVLCQHDYRNLDPKKDEKIGGQDYQSINSDIDYTRTIDTPLTLEVNFTDQQLALTGEDPEDEDAPIGREADIIALARNLYWPTNFGNFASDELERKFTDYMDMRHVMAVNNLAHSSFANIVGMKTEYVPSEDMAATPDQSGPAYMKVFMQEFGLNPDEIDAFLGKNPSYYAQMDVLTKKMYQSPDFYTNLYDKPANVRRIGVSLDAIKLMQMRDQYESNTRREMHFSLLLEHKIQRHMEKLNLAIGSIEANQ